MKANELRIGNLVYNPNLKEVRTLDILDIRDYAEQRLIKDFEPIPLTEEWLVKFGLMSIKTELGFWNNGDAIYFSYGFEKSIELKYVHQLQNLYFALTGEELKCNEVTDGRK